MSSLLRPTRSSEPVDDSLVFFAMPYGVKSLRRGDPHVSHNFTDLYEYQIKRPLIAAGLRPQRADERPGAELVSTVAWEGIDRAGIVVVDFSAVSESVALECGWAMCLHKRMIVLAQSEEDIPTNLRGLRPIVYDFTPKGTGELVERLLAEIERLRRQPLREMDLTPRNSLTSTVVRVEAVFDDRVRVRDKLKPDRSAELYRDDVSYTEVLPPKGMPKGKKFQVDGELRGAFLLRDDVYIFSQKEIEDDPWDAWETAYPVHSEVQARVSNVVGHDAYIDLPGGGKSRFTVYPGEEVQREDAVTVLITRVDRALHRIDVRRVAAAATLTDRAAYPAEQEHLAATVRDVRLDQGFLLVDLDEYPNLPRPAILNIRKMTKDLREQFESERIIKGDRLQVQVMTVTADRKRPGLMKIEVGDLTPVDSGELDQEPVG
ncbi:hypothetical protein ADL07_01900 [Streptomyces sp. NRRL F-4707]|uniref:hypothetical protein n=1 Tax=Streptomyces sp. NRRL F-4707 TaxID=1519496 RepID=UPI0006AF7ACD|nr:hypothetical protein [Streptomyces sp. NRRL F-4707]KOX38991.1 hypothetical protein ADL07_01900 [Streptomyces sp. NRRL F-4707]